MGDFDDRVVVVTGGGGGIGSATARMFAARGAAVAVVDIDRPSADRVTAEIQGAGGSAMAVAIDVSSEDDVRGMVASVTDRFGPIAVLHNNAAYTDIAPDSVPLTELDMAHWDQAMAVNVRGYALVAKHVVPEMMSLGSGAIVNTASGAGIHGDLVRTAYGTSKAAIIGLTRYIATQFGRFGVRCNAIAPGLIATPAVARELTAEMRDVITSHQLTRPLGQPEDIAELVTFLASDRARFITGETISIDGGLSAHSPMYAETIRMFDAPA